MKAITILFFVTFLFSMNAHSVRQCSDFFEKSLPTLSSPAAKLVESVAKFVEKNANTPTKSELISSSKLTKEKYEEILDLPEMPATMKEIVELAKIHFPHHFKKQRQQLIKKYAVFVKDHMRAPSNAELAELLEIAPNKLTLIYGSTENIIARAESDFPNFLDAAKNKIILAYSKTAKELGRTPELEEVAETLEVEVEGLKSLVGKRGLFESETELLAESQLKKPAAFKEVIDTTIFNNQRLSDLSKAIEEKDTLILTTAVAGAPVDVPFFNSLLRLAKEKNGTVLVYASNMQTHGLDPLLLETPNVHIVSNSIELSNHIKLNNIKVTAKHMKPLAGLEDFEKRNQVQIVGSPKMHMKTVATTPGENATNPHQLISTGAVTRPNYNGKKYVSKRTDAIAEYNHVMGALILEKSKGQAEMFEGDSHGFYHYRHVEYIPEKKGFTDLDKFYTEDKAVKTRPEAVVLGDIHVGETDPKVLQAFVEQIVKLNPKRIVLHDLFNGESISHHEKDKVLTMAQKAEKGKLDLRKELNEVTHFLNSILSVAKDTEIMIISSNHNSWVNRWLEDGQFMKEPINTKIGIELASLQVDNVNPLDYALINGIKKGEDVLVSGIESSFRNRVEFSREGDSYKVGPDHRLVELGLHGHAGSGGARGSVPTFRKGVDRIVYGHTHTEERINGTVNIGTFTQLFLPYNRDGLSSWVQSLAIVGANGEIQAFRYKEGEFYAQKKVGKSTHFFKPNYPLVIRPEYYNEEGQIDQYN